MRSSNLAINWAGSMPSVADDLSDRMTFTKDWTLRLTDGFRSGIIESWMRSTRVSGEIPSVCALERISPRDYQH